MKRVLAVLFAIVFAIAGAFAFAGCRQRSPDDEAPRFVVRSLASIACELVTTHPDVPPAVAAIATAICEGLAAELAEDDDDAGTDGPAEAPPTTEE